VADPARQRRLARGHDAGDGQSQWEKALLYPAGYAHSRITFAPSVKLPTGWEQASALEPSGREGDVLTFAPISLEHLADSPMFAGKHFPPHPAGPAGPVAGSSEPRR
jgi:predicted metalloprotease with PDZ domain